MQKLNTSYYRNKQDKIDNVTTISNFKKIEEPVSFQEATEIRMAEIIKRLEKLESLNNKKKEVNNKK